MKEEFTITSLELLRYAESLNTSPVNLPMNLKTAIEVLKRLEAVEKFLNERINKLTDAVFELQHKKTGR